MTRQNVIIRFRNFWNKLDMKEQYDLWNVLTALRSNDEENLDLKDLSTNRIRWNVFKLPHDKSISTMRKEVLSKKEITKRDRLLKKISTHFHRHFISAKETLQKFKMWID